MATRPKSRWRAVFYWSLTAIYVSVAGLAVTATWLVFTVRYPNTTQNKPFTADDEGFASYRFAAFKALEDQGLPNLASLGSDGIRVVLTAYMNPYSYALTVGGKGDPVSGTLVIYSRQKPPPPATIKHFTMPRSDYEQLMKKLDLLAVPYRGEGLIWMCGSDIMFERLRGTEVISGADNVNNSYYKPIAKTLYPLFKKVAAPDLEIYTNWASTPSLRPTGAGC